MIAAGPAIRPSRFPAQLYVISATFFGAAAYVVCLDVPFLIVAVAVVYVAGLFLIRKVCFGEEADLHSFVPLSGTAALLLAAWAVSRFGAGGLAVPAIVVKRLAACALITLAPIPGVDGGGACNLVFASWSKAIQVGWCTVTCLLMTLVAIFSVQLPLGWTALGLGFYAELLRRGVLAPAALTRGSGRGRWVCAVAWVAMIAGCVAILVPK